MKMKNIAVIGFGKSGQAAYEALKSLNHNVYVFDDEAIEDDSVENLFTGDKKEAFYNFKYDEVVVSPGVPKFHSFIRYALEKDIPIISELELGYRFAKCPIIAVTGTNGKTTTVALIEKIMKNAKKKVIACGNYGLPISQAAIVSENLDYLIVEASSFQLEFINKFKPFISSILNIGSDHIKWHGTKKEYKKAKLRIFKNQDVFDYIIKNEEDSYVYDGNAHLLEFSKQNPHKDCFINKNKVVVNYKSKIIIQNTKLFGAGNAENIAVSVLVSKICGIDDKIITEVVENMENLENRIEFVGELDGIKFYNDSKSTNIDSVVNALNSFEGNNIVLILGGKHKGESFSKIVKLLEEKTRAVVVYGEDKHQIMKELDKMLPVPLPALDVRGSLVGAFEVAAKGDIVLFSPGGSSCKPFKNYQERGQAFKEEFEKYKEYYEKTPNI